MHAPEAWFDAKVCRQLEPAAHMQIEHETRQEEAAAATAKEETERQCMQMKYELAMKQQERKA
jgi:hypothetical protein